MIVEGLSKLPLQIDSGSKSGSDHHQSQDVEQTYSATLASAVDKEQARREEQEREATHGDELLAQFGYD
jgi:hypothetical protein